MHTSTFQRTLWGVLLGCLLAGQAYAQCSNWDLLLNETSTNTLQVKDMTIDAAGNQIITGHVQQATYPSTFAFGDTTLGFEGFWDYIVAKYDAAGNFLWARTGGGTQPDEGSAIATDAAGNVYVAGIFQNTITIGSTSYALGITQKAVFVVKYGPNGNVIWVDRSESTGGNVQVRGLELDAAGDIYITGYTNNSSMTFGTASVTYTTSSNPKMYLAKYSNAGAEQWVTSVGVNLGGEARHLTITPSNEVLVSGGLFGTETVAGTSINETGSTAAYAAEFSTAGAVNWVRVYPSDRRSYADAIGYSASGDLFVGITYRSDNFSIAGRTFANSSSNLLQWDGLVMRTNSTGAPLWARQFRGDVDETIVGLEENAAGELVALGMSSGPNARIEQDTSGILVPANRTTLATYDANGTLVGLKSGTGTFPSALQLVNGNTQAVVGGFYNFNARFETLLLRGNQLSGFILRSTTANPAVLQVDTVIDAGPCRGDATGAIELSAFVGTPPYLYRLVSGSDTLENSTGVFTGLEGNRLYEPQVIDQAGCLSEAYSIYIQEPAPLFVSFTQTADSVCRNETGVAYTVDSTAGASYYWTAPVGATIVSGQGTANVVLDFASFTGGDLQVFESLGACASDTISTYIGVSGGNFTLPDLDINCEQATFAVPINGGPTTADVIGLDFCMQYDTAVMTPTGTATLGDVVTGGNPSFADYFLNISTPGEIYGVIYYTAAAPFPTYMQGNGLVIEIDYTLNPGVPAGTSADITLCGMSEGTLSSGNVESCSGLTSSVEVVSDPTFVGSLMYGNNAGRSLTYVPGSTLPTQVVGTDSFCNPTGYLTVADSAGDFAFNTDSASYLRLERDIPGDFNDTTGCTNVMAVINGTDQNRTLRLATLDATFVPTVYELLSADVNLDGVVSSADVTLIGARSVMSICGFPNQGGNPSIDWLFLPAGLADSVPAYQISATFPLDDGVGYSRSRIPGVDGCFEIPITEGPLCTEVGSGSYEGILLGDVNGDWNTPDGAFARPEEAPELVLDFTQATFTDLHTRIPVFYANTEAVEAIDFFIEASTPFDINGVALDETFEDWYLTWNMRNEREFLLTSFSLNPAEAEGQAMEIYFDGVLSVEAMEQIVSAGEAYLNGEPATLRLLVPDEVTGLGDAPATQLHVYPNPAAGLVTLQLPEDAQMGQGQLRITDLRGVVVLEQAWTNTRELQLHVGAWPQGVYLVEVRSETTRYQATLVH